MTRGGELASGVAVSDGMAVSGGAVTTGAEMTTGGGADRANHLSQLVETVVTTTLANPRTAIMS
jgi:hypothetical protein